MHVPQSVGAGIAPGLRPHARAALPVLPGRRRDTAHVAPPRGDLLDLVLPVRARRPGRRLWELVKQLLRQVDSRARDVVRARPAEAAVEIEQTMLAGRAAAARRARPEQHRRRRPLPPDVGHVAGREAELYAECARRVGGLDWAQVVEIGGAKVAGPSPVWSQRARAPSTRSCPSGPARRGLLRLGRKRLPRPSTTRPDPRHGRVRRRGAPGGAPARREPARRGPRGLAGEGRADRRRPDADPVRLRRAVAGERGRRAVRPGAGRRTPGLLGQVGRRSRRSGRPACRR